MREKENEKKQGSRNKAENKGRKSVITRKINNKILTNQKGKQKKGT